MGDATNRQPQVGTGDPESYGAAEAELQTILEALEADNVDVDQLIGLVERARTLIVWCRQRVEHTETTIKQLLEDPPT